MLIEPVTLALDDWCRDRSTVGSELSTLTVNVVLVNVFATLSVVVTRRSY